jgi:uncharacterized metal-binding protein YceD (DUF177 family)
MMSSEEIQPTLSLRYDADELLRLPQGRLNIELAADQRALLAEQAGVEAVHELLAQFKVIAAGRGLHIGGPIKGKVAYLCGVSLEPYDADVLGDLDLTFQPVERERTNRRRRETQAAKQREGRVEERVVDVDPDVDPPEPIIDGWIDLGPLLAEHFILALDPYPRKPGVAFQSDALASAEEPEAPPSPFAALAGLKKPDPKG